MEMESKNSQKVLMFLIFFDTPEMEKEVFRNYLTILSIIAQKQCELFFVRIDKNGVWHLEGEGIPEERESAIFILKKIICQMAYRTYGKAIEELLTWGPALLAFDDETAGIYSSEPREYRFQLEEVLSDIGDESADPMEEIQKEMELLLQKEDPPEVAEQIKRMLRVIGVRPNFVVVMDEDETCHVEWKDGLYSLKTRNPLEAFGLISQIKHSEDSKEEIEEK